MDVTDRDQPNSICQVERIEMYQLPPADGKLSLPFALLDGEAVAHSGTSRDGPILLTNYRLYLQIGRNHYHVPLGLIEIVEHKELFYLQIGCKDARTYRCTFENNEMCMEWYDKIIKAAEPPRQLNQLFAFYHFVHFKGNDDQYKFQKQYSFDINVFTREMERLQFEKSLWRISKVNINYELCGTYPPYLLVPKDIDDEELKKVAKFRSSRRIPAVVWRHTKNGAVIARCSQPEVGWFGWRGEEDEKLIQLISKNKDNVQEKKVLILDARSYAIAVANRARGGGCECPEYYSNCEIQFMNLANIHSIRKSFHALRQLCMSAADQTWHSQLENTKWLQHMSGLMKAAVTLVTAVDTEGRPAVVHCSDGWDRTPQIVALAELLMDPYYRTIQGFRVLIEREWCAFGHKFADRCGHSTGSEDPNERCPAFLQWLDCVHQVVKQFSCAFEFSQAFLVKLAQHTYSNLFGTFLCNTLQDRNKIVTGKTFAVWEFLNGSKFKNHLYEQTGNINTPQVLWPQCNVRDLQLWNEMYLGTMEANFRTDPGSEACPGPPDLLTYHMTKTRSYNDLAGISDGGVGHFRRRSDPNINIDKELNALFLDNVTQSQQQQQQQPQETKSNHSIQENGHPSHLLNSQAINELDEECNPDCIFNVNKRTHNGTSCADGVDLIDVYRSIPPERSIGGPVRVHSVAKFASPNDRHENGAILAESSPGVAIPFLFENVIDKTEEDKNELSLCLDDVSNAKLDRHQYGDRVLENGDCSRTTSNGGESDILDRCDNVVSGANGVVEGVEFCCNGGSGVGGVGDVNNFLEDADDLVDSGTECTEPSESKSDNIVVTNKVCDVNAPLFVGNHAANSVETSTETLVSETVVLCGSSPKEINGFEKIQSPSEPIDIPDGRNGYVYQNGSSSGPQGTSSSNGWDNTLSSPQKPPAYQAMQQHLGEDGLIRLQSPVQERVLKIIEEGKRKEEKLEKELHAYRQVLINQICLRCSGERFDDNGSVIESGGSICEGHASAVESLPSDKSWENLDYSVCSELQGTKWVPDHAVTRCTNCNIQFWIGKRKHHCRNCGNIFCADCSSTSAPLPSEQLYKPVRVCTGCFKQLQRDCSDLLGSCKQANPQTTNNNPQITASSN